MENGYHQEILRDQVSIATKIQKKYGQNIKNLLKRINKKAIKVAAERSLARLKTDYIDIIYLHWPADIQIILEELIIIQIEMTYIPLENQHELQRIT